MKNLLLILILIFFSSCRGDEVNTPKPRLYPKIDFPEKNTELIDLDFCKFSFEFSDYAKPVQDSFYFEESIIDQCWFDLIFESLNGRLHCSYIQLKDRAHFDEMVQDAYELVMKHNIKANYRNEKRIDYPNRQLYGIMYEIEGPVASPMQFYLTDSTEHFLRASLYFNAQVDEDSIAPVYNFIKSDIQGMIKSFNWK